MPEYKREKNNEERQFFDGTKNRSIRYYFYTQRALALLNEFRYLVMGIFGLYYTLKMENPFMLVVMFAVSIPLLILLGWVAVHHVEKVIEYLRIEFSTYWSRYNYNLLEKQLKVLDSIDKHLGKEDV